LNEERTIISKGPSGREQAGLEGEKKEMGDGQAAKKGPFAPVHSSKKNLD